MDRRVVAAILVCAAMVLVTAIPLAIADAHIVLKGDQGPRASAVTWEFRPTTLGIWTGHIVNNGLRSLVVDVYDNTTGVPEEIMHQKIRFADYGAYPTGVTSTGGVIVAPGHIYSITATPNGPKGSSCTVDDTWPVTHPVAMFTVTEGDMGILVDGSSSYDPDGMVVAYAWDFGDGSSSTGETAIHSYLYSGIYMITLTVTDNDGATGSASKEVVWSPQFRPPVAIFTVSIDWEGISVDGSGSYDVGGTIASYAWDFGDGLGATGMTAVHTYASAGTYMVTLTVTDDDMLTGSASSQVTWIPLPHSPFPMFAATLDCLTVYVDGSGSYDLDGTIVLYSWDFGDGSSATGMMANHTYAASGTYAITLMVMDDDGYTGSTSEQITV